MESLFYDPKHGLGSMIKFAAKARQAGFKNDEIKTFLNRQETLQLNKERGRTQFFPEWGYGPGSYQMDIMFQQDPRNKTRLVPILNIIDVNTRYLYAFIMRDRTAGEVLKAVMQWLDEVKSPKMLQSDNERAFTSRALEELLARHSIQQRFVLPEDHRGQAEVERVHQTLRRLFTLYEDAFKEPWTNGFKDLVWNYNHRLHKGIGVAPADATEESGLAERIQQYRDAQRAFLKFKVGDHVRKAVTKSTRFDKGRATWSDAVYTITGVQGHLFQLSDGTLQKHYDLQLIRGVDKPTQKESLEPKRQAAKTAKKATRALKKTGVQPYNAPGEQEASQAEKRQTKARETFVAQPSNLKDLKALRDMEQAKVKRQGERVPRFVQKFVHQQWIRGKVLPDLRVKYLDGTSGVYSKDLVQSKTLYKFPLDKADKKVYAELLPRLEKLT